MKRAEVGGRSVAYDDVGAGPPLVLLHAFPLDRRMWWAVATELAGRFRVIAPDARGFGESSPGAPYALTDLADDVAALMDVLGLARATIGGLSLGGYVALAFAARHAHRLEALVLADTKAAPDTPEARAGREAAMTLVREQSVAVFVEQQLPKLLSAGASPEVRTRTRELGRQNQEAVLAALPALRDRPDRRPELRAIACPTLIVVGELDVVTPPAEAESMRAAIPGARLRRLPAAGHLSALEDPRAFAAAITPP